MGAPTYYLGVNAYLNANTREKIYTTAGAEFGSKAGCYVVIVCSLCGLKSSGSACMESTHGSNINRYDLTHYLEDPDVWMHSAQKADGFQYWEYVLFMWMMSWLFQKITRT